MDGLTSSLYKFKVDSGNQYLFDNVSGTVIYCPDFVYEIIRNFYHCNKQEMQAELSKKYSFSISEFNEKYDYIKSLIEKGYFYEYKNKSYINKTTYEEMLLNSPTSQLVLIVTEDCNLKCRYCVFSDMYPDIKSFSNEKMSYEIAKKALDYYMSIHKKRVEHGYVKKAIVGFYGGEPLLSFELIKRIVNYSKIMKYECDFYITTNGTILDKEIIDFFIDNSFYIAFSLDGNKKNHDRNRVFAEARGTFDCVMTNIKSLQNRKLEKGVKIPITFNCCYDNYSSMIDIVSFFSDNKIFEPCSIFFSPVSKYNTEYYNFCDKLKDEGKITNTKDTCMNSIIQIQEKYINEIIKGKEPQYVLSSLFLGYYLYKNRVIGRKSILENACIPGSKIAVDPKGNFYICERMNQSHSIGNVINGIQWEKVDDILQKYQNIKNKNCSDCNLSRLCDVCFLHVNLNGSGKFKFNLEFCKDKRNLISKMLETLYSTLEKNNNAFEVNKTFEEFNNVSC